MIALNMQTVMVASVVIQVVCLIVMLQLWRNSRDKFAGLSYWVVDWALQIIGGLLVALRGTVPDWASMVLGNTIIISGTLVLYFGLCKFAGKKNPRALNFIIALYFLAFIIIQIYFRFIDDDLLSRSINVSSGLVLTSLLAMWLLFRGVGAEIRAVAKGTGIAFGILALISLLRISGFLWLPQTNNDFLRSGPVDTLLMMLISGSVAFLVFNLVLMVNRRLYLETKRMEEAVVKTEKELQATFKATSVGFAVLVNRVIKEVNEAACKMLGYSRQELIGKDTRMFYATEEEYQKSAALYPQVAALGTITTEIGLIRKDGTIFSAIVNISALDKNNLPQGVVLSLIDISERKQSEQALLASEENFRNSMDNSPMGIRIVTESGETLYANRSVLDIFGYDSLEELQATPLKNRCTPATYEEYRIRLDKRQRGEPVQDKNEISIVRKDGAIRHLQIFRKEVFWEGKRQYQVIYQDITERKQTEEALLSSEENFRNSMDNSPLGIRIADKNGKSSYVNPAFINIFGYENLEEMWSVPIKNRLTPQSYAEYLENREKLRRGEQISDSFVRNIVRKDGAIRHLQVFRKEVLWGGKTQYQFLYQDITERKQTEKALISSEENFRNSMDNSPLGIRIADKNAKTLYANRSILDIYGYENLEEMVASPVKNRLTASSYASFLISREKLSLGEQVSDSFESSIVRKDGAIRHLQVFRKEVLWGGKTQYQFLYQDITERKLTEEALLISEENFRNSMDDSPMGIRIIGKDGKTLYLNRSLLNMWGYENLEEFKATPDKYLYSPQSYADHPIRMEKRLRGEPVNDNYENTIVRKDGDIRRFQVFRKEVVWGGERQYQALYLDITERKQAEEALISSEENFRNSMDSSPFGIRIVGKEGETLYANQALLNIYGEDSLTDFQSISFEKRLTPESQAKYQIRQDMRLRSELIPLDFESSIVRKDGDIRHLQVFRREVLWGGKKQYQLLFQDITERKQAEEGLISSEENFRNLMDNAPMGIRIIAKDGKTLYVNRSLLNIWGYENLEEFQATPVKNLYSPQSYADYRIRREKRLRCEPVNEDYENTIMRKDGDIRRVQVFRKEVVWGGERQYQALYLDITERKQAEEALISSEENFRNSMDNSPLGIRIVAESGETLYNNQAFLDIYGYNSLADFEAVPFKKRYSPESAAAIQKRIDKRRSGGGISGNNEISIVHKDGKLRHIQVFYKRALWRGKMQYQAFYLDITERKQAEETLKLAAEQLAESYEKEKHQRLELEEEARSRGMLIDILGHELRTPLTPLTLCADMLQTAYSSQEGGIEKKLVDNISTSTKLLARRLDELLDLAKYSRGDFTLHFQKVKVADLINQTALRFQSLSQQEGKSLLLEIQVGLAEIEADPSHLEQVLENLLSNALKYSPKDGHITLKAYNQDSNLIIEVQNDGQGLSPDEQEKLFNPYHRVRQDTQKYPGIGLGLAISKQIVEAHQGKIWVESQLGQGSTFIVQLPISQSIGGN